MKKKIAVLLMMASCMTTMVFADNTANVINNNGAVSVTGQTSPDTVVSLTVKSEDDDSGLYAIKETVSDSEGNYSFDFTLRKRQTEQDVYRYLLSIKGDGVYSESINIYSQTAIDGFIAGVNASNLNALLAVEDNLQIARSLGVNVDDYQSLASVQEAICEAFYVDADSVTADSFAGIFNQEILLYKSKAAGKAEFDEMMKSDFESRSISDFTKERLYETKSYNNIAEYEKQIAMFEALNKVNNAKYSQLEDIFEANKELLTLDTCGEYGIYKAMSSADRRTVNETIVSALLNDPAHTTGDFIDIFADTVNDVGASSSVSGGGSIGGGGSSGGGGSMAGGKGSTTTGSGAVVGADTSKNEIPEPEPVFSDVPNDFWASEDIRNLVELGIINGYEDGSFKAENSITREEFVTILVKAFKLYNANAECSFSDVGADTWFYPYVASAYNAGVVGGISETEFGTGRNVTRQDVAVMIARVMKLTETAENAVFADDAEIADYAKASVYALKNLGIIGGKDGNVFDPYGECTRAECAKMINRALNVK